MSASFVAASSQRLITTPNLIAAPMTIGMWFNPSTVTSGTLFGAADNGGTVEFFRVGLTGSKLYIAASQTSGGEQQSPNATSLTVGRWYYMVARFISGTNRRISILARDFIEHAQGTTSKAPASVDATTLGNLETSSPSDFYNGQIAEFWFTQGAALYGDIQPDAAQLQNSTLWQLAYGGPFSVPHIAANIREYHSFRKSPMSANQEIGEDYYLNLPRANAPTEIRIKWTNTNGVTVGPHPPLPYWNVKPGQRKRVLPI